MREKTWLTCDDPRALLKQVHRPSPRKLRLLAAACCRRVWPLLFDDRLKRAVEVSERFADGEAGPADLDAARAAARAVVQTAKQPSAERYVGGAVLAVVARESARLRSAPDHLLVAVARAAAWHRYRPGRPQPSDPAAADRERGPFCDLIRDIFGNPFRTPPAIEPSWLAWGGGAAGKPGLAIYQERAFDRLPVLADALEEAGCSNVDILAHCRSGGEHVRGCWVVDLVRSVHG
jgi:hypothetical protein